MNNIKSEFSIKDLENLSGIKAHTIRIWEKRYNLLQPNRSDTNIRNYSIKSLQKLLNIAYLNNNGLKISKISDLNDNEIPKKVREIATSAKQEHHAINSLKISMLNFDQVLFYNTYNRLLDEKSFKDIFYHIFLPFLNEIGLLWQTNTILPVHEHFISTLIKQKILINLEKLQSLEPKPNSKTCVLFLPENEIHDIGLLFVNYELRCKGYHTIFLGESVPIGDLTNFQTLFNDITFISYFTVKPENKDINKYINNFSKLIINKKEVSLLILGHKTHFLKEEDLPKNIYKFNSIKNLIEYI